jgi:DNA repair exonuclease SbcCD nuclease subunit
MTDTLTDTLTLREADGLLFVGDPHLTSIRPGRRRDADFSQSILTKIDSIVDLANERQLVIVFEGDMFDVHKEEDQALITKLIRSLSRCWTWSISNVGNHDMEHTTLSDGDSMAILKAAGVLAVATQSGPVEEFLLGSGKRRVGLGMTPYGQAIPTDVAGAFPDAEMTVWCTHHDLLFKDAYSGSAPLHEIAGCQLAINGHLHLEKPPEIRGMTRWVNPGNITRMSIDAIDHVPAVRIVRPGPKDDFEIEKVEFPDPPDLFDLTGYQVAPVSQSETARLVREEASAFVELLRTEASMEMEKSDDGALLREEIERKCEAEDAPAAVKAIMLSLLDEAVRRGRAA